MYVIIAIFVHSETILLKKHTTHGLYIVLDQIYWMTHLLKSELHFIFRQALLLL